MPEPLRPAPAKTFGRENWIFVPTIAVVTAPTVAEITAASALDITRIVFADGEPNPESTTNVVDETPRLGDTEQFQSIGRTTYGSGQMRYQLDPQAAAASDAKKAWEKFLNTSGPVSGNLVRRLNVPRATNVIAGQFVDVYPVEIGPSTPTKAGDGESAQAAAAATFVVVAPPAFVKAVAA